MANSPLEAARDLKEQGRTQEAAQLYHHILLANPKDVAALKALGQIYFEAGQAERARYLFDEAVRIDPFDLDILCLHGVTLLQLRRWQEAIRNFDRALTLQPDFTAARINRGAAFQELGRYEEAVADLGAVLRAEPGNAGAWNNLGTAYVAMGYFEDAMMSYDKAADALPGFELAHDNRKNAFTQALAKGKHETMAKVTVARGVELMRRRQFADALASFDDALALAPTFIDALSNRATALFELGRGQEAAEAFDTALAVDPNHAISWNNRGNVLSALGRFEEALESYDRALGVEPGLVQAEDNRANALFALKRLDRCPPAYMRRLFDDFSSHYDATMIEKLQYRAHLHLRDMAERVLPPDEKGKRVLDLGSGTGLVGETFKDRALGGRLDGIDLSPRMNDTARTRGLYDDLILGDVETVLHEDGPAYDLILAADTMIYLGDLGKVFTGVAKRLVPGGFYIFAVEAKDGDGWEQTKTHRFRHSRAYLSDAAREAGLELVDIADCVLRSESGTPVAGFTVALKKS